MMFWFGIFLFALGILVSVCLHEAGHLITAKRFGMKATQYFAGFGPTLWSFRRGETEYGVKAIPAGGFVKIIGMTPLEDKLAPADEHRAFWRAPLWQRTIVLVAGSATHFLLAGVIFFFMAFTTGMVNPAAVTYDAFEGPPVIGAVSNCVVPGYELNRDKDNFRACTSADPVGPAKAAGLLPGDRLLSVGGKPTESYGDVVEVVRASPPGPVDVVYERGGERRTTTTDLVATRRPPTGDTTGRKLVTVSAIGVSPDAPQEILHYSVAGAVPAAGWYVGETVKQTFQAIGNFPSKIPNLIDSIGGQPRDRATPISVVGASRIGGEAAERSKPIVFLTLLGGLNVFIGVFNLFPLLPLDGGHVAIIWFEKVRSWWASRRGRPDPGRVDYNKLLPVTYVVLLLFGGLTLLTLTADIVNPLRLG